jgi:hypothetical protein
MRTADKPAVSQPFFDHALRFLLRQTLDVHVID